ncbi:RNA-binding protein 44 isoform X1 [Pygocentrus nattereri]|uniref:RRM domain-containing protein n=1 Tax=Pygocentrus nattereri TaxID=42514 RepID=A0A3B4CIW4_PYGNA|nr:RNA-binding protein 44 isoform X1 [Pygocentrus nattereri]
MWYPPSVLVPCYLEPYSRRASDVSTTTVMWQLKPFEQQLYLATNGIIGFRDPSLYVEDGRKFLLNKSVFDLVNVSRFLELTDPKLLGWYLSLPAEDRKLIQEEGGFFQFLQRHPALEVTRHIVHLKQQVLGNHITLPATDMSSKLNKSRHPTFYGASQCLNCGTGCIPGAKKCRRCNTPILNLQENVCISEEEKSLGLLPNSVKEELNLLKAKRHEGSVRSLDQLGHVKSTSDTLSAAWIASANRCQQALDDTPAAQNSPYQQETYSTEAQYLSQLWEEGMWNDATEVFKDPVPQADVSLDMELERQGSTLKSDQEQALIDTSADFLHLNQETLPEYYSLNSTGLEQTSAQWSDVTESLQPGHSDSLMATKGSTKVSSVDEPVEDSTAPGPENCTFPDSVSCNSSEWTDYTEDYQDLSNDDNSGCDPKTDEYHDVADEVPSSSGALVSNPSLSGSGSGSKQRTPIRVPEESCFLSGQSELNIRPTGSCQKCEGSPVPLGVSKAVDATGDFRCCFTSTQATETVRNTFVKPCRDVALGTESFTINCEQETQTLQVSTSEKCVITEVRMSDLDALSEEFEYLKMMEEELKYLKKKMASPGCDEGPGSTGPRNACGCGAVHRARQAELHLLALQFVMCQQHCWRCFYTSPLGETALHRTEALPGGMLQTLKTLEDDYLKMKRMILGGIHLDDLEPLSVDTCRITTGARYSPTLACLGDPLKEASSSSDIDAEDQLDQASQVFNMETIDGGLRKTTSPQDNAAISSESKGDGSKRCRAVFVLNQESGVSSDTKPGVPKDVNSSEAWFDAEEELGCDDRCSKEEKQTGQYDKGDIKMEHKGDRNGNADQSSFLYVTNLPSNVTECDLLLWLERYHASQVTTFNKNRTAVVIVKSPSDAEKAVREMNGQSIQGHTIHVEHIHGSAAGSQNPIKALCAERFPAAYKARPAGEGLHMHGSKNDFQSSRPLRCSLDRLINIDNKPTASGTCVPEHYATMGSFDTLMARLSERHPKVSRQRIVGALLELRAKHQGSLSGLPLKAIADMASGLLTQQCTAK